MKNQVYSYRVYVKGLFGRNRKIKFEGFDVGVDLPEKLTLEEAKSRMEYVLKTIVKPKGDYFLKLSEQPMTLEKHDGYKTREFKMYSGIDLFSEMRKA